MILIKCDAKGCEETVKVRNDADPGQIPDGWARVTLGHVSSDELPGFGATVISRIIGNAMSRLSTPSTKLCCPKHVLPEWADEDKGEVTPGHGEVTPGGGLTQTELDEVLSRQPTTRSVEWIQPGGSGGSNGPI